MHFFSESSVIVNEMAAKFMNMATWGNLAIVYTVMANCDAGGGGNTAIEVPMTGKSMNVTGSQSFFSSLFQMRRKMS